MSDNEATSGVATVGGLEVDLKDVFDAIQCCICFKMYMNQTLSGSNTYATNGFMRTASYCR